MRRLLSPVRLESSAATAIPDTTLAVNSAQPMSQRVVHYEIDAKYDLLVKHTVDATEVVTYHNLTMVNRSTIFHSISIRMHFSRMLLGSAKPKSPAAAMSAMRTGKTKIMDQKKSASLEAVGQGDFDFESAIHPAR